MKVNESLEERIRRHPFSERSRNENERRVVKKILEILEEYPDVCFCEKCLDDMFRIALNALPAKYENAVAHEMRKKNSCTKEEIETATKYAIKAVCENPKSNVEHPHEG